MSFVNGKHDIFIEFRDTSVHLLHGERTLELPLEREANGRLPAHTLNSLAEQMRDFLGGTSNAAYCSIPARGVSLRRLSVPGAAPEETQRLLAMQLEAQLPIAPSELAWGSLPLGRDQSGKSGSAGLQEFLVIAVKKDVLDDYRRVLSTAGVEAVFTVGALARQALCPRASADFSVLDTDRHRSELASFDRRGPLGLRVLPWGFELNGESPATTLRHCTGEKLYLLEDGRGQESLGRALSGHLKTGTTLEVVDARGRSTTANKGLRRLLESGEQPVLLGAHEPVRAPARRGQWKWLALTLLLAVAAMLLRYAESIVYQARLSRKLASIAAYRSSLPKLEREFNFLNYIKTNQPPYLDTLAVLAQSAPPGTRIDTLSIVRHGDITLRGNAGDAQAAGTFRSKLIDSGFFSRVVLDEQAPTADSQKFTFRISALVKPDGYRKPLTIPEKAISTNAPQVAPAPGPTK